MTTHSTLRVIFVDDEQCILDGLRRQLHPMRASWHMRWALSGADALRQLGEAPVDVIVSDMRMPGMTGVELLSAVHQRWPETVRIILSGQTDQADLLADIGVIHQFLQKPCDTDTLRRSILRTSQLAHAFRCEPVRRVVTGLRSLPVLARSLRELSEAMDSARSDIGQIAGIVSRDVGLSTKVLQLVNSAFFGMPRRVHEVREAVSLLGVKTLREVAVAARAFEALAGDSTDRPVIERLWSMSADLAGAAGDAARRAGLDQDAENRARLAASLALVGRAVLARYAPDQHVIARVMAEHGTPLSDAELYMLGISHQAVGAYVLGLWAFDDEIIEAVAQQSDATIPETCGPAHPVWFVREARRVVPPGPLHESPLSPGGLESGAAA